MIGRVARGCLVLLLVGCGDGRSSSPAAGDGQTSATPPAATLPAATPPVTGTITACSPSCAGRQCGDDGCSGSCGVCDAASSCTAAGACQAPAAASSIYCPAGQRCVYSEHLAYEYDCTTGACVRGAVLGEYGDAWICQRYACQGGNSTCGDQFGQNSPLTQACEACKQSCGDITGEAVCPPDDEFVNPAQPQQVWCALQDARWDYDTPCDCQ